MHTRVRIPYSSPDKPLPTYTYKIVQVNTEWEKTDNGFGKDYVGCTLLYSTLKLSKAEVRPWTDWTRQKEVRRLFILSYLKIGKKKLLWKPKFDKEMRLVGLYC